MIHVNVTIMVFDLERSLDFYTKVLAFRAGERQGDRYAEVLAPGLTILLHPRDREQGRMAGGDVAIGIRVADISVAAADLTSKGIRVTIQENDANRLALFEDPDGTSMYLIEVKSLDPGSQRRWGTAHG